MTKRFWLNSATLLMVGIMLFCSSLSSHAAAVSIPAPAKDMPLASEPGSETIVLAGGCFWGVQAVFQHLKGVTDATSGYAGGSAKSAKYEIVSGGATGHAEAVKITYDPSKISLGKILQVYFSVAHNPTELNFQGPDHGTQYRSAIFYATPEQKTFAENYIQQLEQAKSFSAPIVTTLESLKEFYPAEDYHQNYATLHPNNPYIVMHDAPKLTNLEKTFPELLTK